MFTTASGTWAKIRNVSAQFMKIIRWRLWQESSDIPMLSLGRISFDSTAYAYIKHWFETKTILIASSKFHQNCTDVFRITQKQLFRFCYMSHTRTQWGWSCSSETGKYQQSYLWNLEQHGTTRDLSTSGMEPRWSTANCRRPSVIRGYGIRTTGLFGIVYTVFTWPLLPLRMSAQVWRTRTARKQRFYIQKNSWFENFPSHRNFEHTSPIGNTHWWN